MTCSQLFGFCRRLLKRLATQEGAVSGDGGPDLARRSSVAGDTSSQRLLQVQRQFHGYLIDYEPIFAQVRDFFFFVCEHIYCWALDSDGEIGRRSEKNGRFCPDWNTHPSRAICVKREGSVDFVFVCLFGIESLLCKRDDSTNSG